MDRNVRSPLLSRPSLPSKSAARIQTTSLSPSGSVPQAPFLQLENAHLRRSSWSLGLKITYKPLQKSGDLPFEPGDVRLDPIQRARWFVDVEIPVYRNFVADLGLAVVHPGIGHMGQHLATLCKRRCPPGTPRQACSLGLSGPKPISPEGSTVLGGKGMFSVSLSSLSGSGRPFLSRQISASGSRSPRAAKTAFLDRGRESCDAGPLRGLHHIGLEYLTGPCSAHFRSSAARTVRIAVLLLPPLRDLAIGRRHVLPLSLMSLDSQRHGLLVEQGDALRRRLEVHAQGASRPSP